jgi:hypothetical protein
MSKFDAVYKRIEEALPQMPAAAPTATKPAAQPTPQQQQAALQQFAQAMGVDAAALQKAIDTLKQQQQKTNTAQPVNSTTSQPAV